MKGKKKKRKVIGKTIMLIMSFVMVAVMSTTMTLAWFFSTDWASSSVTMAGAVGIEVRDHNGVVTSGSGQLHFDISTDYAYPGQAIDVSAAVFNNGGRSISEYGHDEDGTPTMTDQEVADTHRGSECYVRAHFAVYTNIGVKQDGDLDEYPESDQQLNARYLYDFLEGLIETQNKQTDTKYKWVYYRNKNANLKLETKYYFEGEGTDSSEAKEDKGYFYLCQKTSSDATDETKTLYPLAVGATSVFLWNSTFVIPWQLTNYSADRIIYVAVIFQAIQTFIPIIEEGEISKKPDNQLPAEQCTYDNNSVQTVFNSCMFDTLNIEQDLEDLGITGGNYGSADLPNSETP